MSDLISRSALLDSLIYCQGLGRKACELVAVTINDQPAVSEKEIRDKAIEDFAEAMNNKISEFVLQHKDNLDFASGIAVSWNIVNEIAEKMKEVENERINVVRM